MAACGGGTTSSSSSAPAVPGSPSLTPVAMTSGVIVGAGASFPAPLYMKWGSDYNGVSGVKLNYQSIGSGGGISAIEAKTVDFGASDAPLEQADLDANGLAQFPMVVGGVVIVVNLDGVADGQLKLTPDVLASIYMGKTTTWDDPSITALNPDVDAAGDQDQRRASLGRLGHDLDLHALPHRLRPATCGRPARTRRSPGRSASAARATRASPPACSSSSGSIGYVEYAYAKQTGMTTTQLQNKDGAWVKPSIESFTAAAANADWKASLPSMYMVLVNQPGKRLVADHRRVVHPRAEGAGRRGPRQGDARRSSTGATPTAPPRPRSSTTCRSRRTSTSWSRSRSGRRSPPAARPCGRDRTRRLS